MAFLVAKNKYILQETLFIPTAKSLVRHVIGKEAVAKLNSELLSNHTIAEKMKRCIEEISVDISDQVVMGVKASKFGFAIQLDKSTDVAKCPLSLVYANFMNNNEPKSKLLVRPKGEKIYLKCWRTF